MWKFLIFSVCAILIYSYENQRFRHAYYDCLKQHMTDMELINRDVCSMTDRLKFKDTVDCEGAERRLRISVQMCTLYTWGAQSSISRIYFELTGSYWSILGLILPIFFIWMYFWNQRKIVDKFGELFNKTKKERKKYQLEDGGRKVHKSIKNW